MLQTTIQSIRALILFTVVCGVAYPLIVTGIAKVAFNKAANGWPMRREPKYFWSRPSGTSPQPYNAAASSGTNQGPTNPALKDAVAERIKALGGQTPVPVDLVTASGSGLDPHISPAAAEYQIERVAKARSMPEEQLRALVAQHTQGRQLGVLGEPRVTVLELNRALAAAGN